MRVLSPYQRKYTTKNPVKRMLVQQFINCFVKKISRIDPKKMLEVGCDEGAMTFAIHEKLPNINITSLDIDTDKIAKAKMLNPDVCFVQGDVTQLEFPDNKFDLVVCSEVLEHLTSYH